MKHSSTPTRSQPRHAQKGRLPKWIFGLAGAVVGGIVAVAIVVPLSLTALTAQHYIHSTTGSLPASSSTRTVPDSSCLSPDWAARFDDRCR